MVPFLIAGQIIYAITLVSLLHSYNLIAVHKVAGSCACGGSAHSGISHMLSMHRLLLLLLSSLWKLWREGISLPLKTPDCQVSYSFHYHSPIKHTSAVSFDKLNNYVIYMMSTAVPGLYWDF